MHKIIIIDDEPYVLKYISDIIDWNAHGFEIVNLFQSSDAALEYIENNHVDVVFTDISMPENDGFDFTEVCNEQYPDIKIVFFSAYATFLNAKKALLFNIFDFIEKPLSVPALSETLSRLKSCLTTADKPEPIKNDKMSFVPMVKKYIGDNISKELSLEMISKHFGYAPNYFSTIYKQKSGKYLTDTINEIRIEFAKKLLLDPSEKIANISDRVGYQSKSYFFYMFKSIVKMTPSEYRRKYIKNNTKEGGNK